MSLKNSTKKKELFAVCLFCINGLGALSLALSPTLTPLSHTKPTCIWHSYQNQIAIAENVECHVILCRTAFSFRWLGTTYRQFCKSSPLSSVDTTRRRHHFGRRPTRAISLAHRTRHTQIPFVYIYEKFVSLARDVERERFYWVSARAEIQRCMETLCTQFVCMVCDDGDGSTHRGSVFTDADYNGKRNKIWPCSVAGVGSGAQRTATHFHCTRSQYQ